MQLAQSEPALADLEQAVAIAPNYAWANMSYGLVLYELVPEQRADAVASIQQAFALEPENRDLWHGLLRMIGRLEATELREMYCAQIPSGIELDLEIQKAACQ
ncbi:MAG: hypothetical protein HC822_22320 [Oscillochloris sp.]|nr:hypothetical protein [Oscillochloris sp.]